MKAVKRICAGLVAITCVGGATLAYKISRLKSSEFHTTRSKVDQYMVFSFMSRIGSYKRKKLEEHTKKVKETQDKILLERLAYNADTEYGKRFRFAEIKSREDFRKIHPLTRYDHYKEYVERIAKGEENIITKDKPKILSLTSGTSGNASMLPTIQKQFSTFFLQGITVCFDSLFKGFPTTKQLQKDLKFFYSPKSRMSESGIPIGPNSSSPASSKGLLNLYTTPKAGFEIMTEPEALYVHLLFALRDRNLGMMEANFASLVYMGFVALEKQWQQLVEDIEEGRVNPNLNVSDEVKMELNSLLKADAKRGAELRNEFQKGFDGIAQRIWPYMDLILTTDTGSSELYGQVLKSHYAKGIPIYSPLYAATEGLLGINLWPKDTDRYYLLVPESMVFEFIPIGQSDETQPETLFMDQVEADCIYELVITNISGLYRYRFGDVVKVVRHHNQCPVIEFLYRQGQLLNVHGEKTSENVFYQALIDTVSQWPGVKLVDYTCAESVMLPSQSGSSSDSSSSPYYLVFIELEGDAESLQLSQEQKDLLDRTLQQKAFVYESFRTKGSITTPKVYVVRRGAFQNLKTYLIENTMASANQLKIPRVLKRQDAVNVMLDQVIE
ncbi:GH3 domain-containing protein-like [Glandiceps talaboti]